MLNECYWYYLEPISLCVSLIQPQWSSSFSSNESQFLCLECFPAFQRVDSLSFKARLKFLSRLFFFFLFQHSTQFESRVYICSCAFWLCSLTRNTSPDLGDFFSHRESTSSMQHCFHPTRPLPRPRPRTESGRGRPARCNLGVVVKATQRHRGWKTEIQRSVHGAVTRV